MLNNLEMQHTEFNMHNSKVLHLKIHLAFFNPFLHLNVLTFIYLTFKC